jgi:hypothetical protein
VILIKRDSIDREGLPAGRREESTLSLLRLLELLLLARLPHGDFHRPDDRST